jgi:hypothetical protein
LGLGAMVAALLRKSTLLFTSHGLILKKVVRGLELN